LVALANFVLENCDGLLVSVEIRFILFPKFKWLMRRSVYLQQVRIKNFRNLKDVNIKLRQGLNVLVGRNNVGKTNLFHAIRHALGPSAVQGDSLWLVEDDIFREPQQGISPNPIRIDLTYAGLTENQISQFFEILDVNSLNPNLSTAKIHFEAMWSDTKGRFATKRWGGPDDGEATPIPNEIMEALSLTFLHALRDAVANLTPGHRNRVARLLHDEARRSGVDHETQIKGIFSEANAKLKSQLLVSEIERRLRASTGEMAGSDYVSCSISASDPEFVQVLRTLRLIIDENPIPDLSSSGLGYNNLLYIATVLAHLETAPNDECPILLVEEPEAHLHPQLTVLLGEYLRSKIKSSNPPQTLLSTHSPTLASYVKPSQISVLFKTPTNGLVQCNSLADVELEEKEERQLQRMLDITRATLYFCKGLVLVEGISEALIIPELARRVGYDLRKSHVSVIPICGVSFEIFKKVLRPEALGIPVAIITDSDPPISSSSDARWQSDVPQPSPSSANFSCSARTTALVEAFHGHPTVKVFCSEVTLEYDLADAGPNNPEIITGCWENSFKGTPRTLNSELLQQAGNNKRERTLAVWRGICRAQHDGSKADFAHILAEWLAESSPSIGPPQQFDVPPYIEQAIQHVLPTSLSALAITASEDARAI
jgi:putative ATP-dependent endonuclease of the OLD family